VWQLKAILAILKNAWLVSIHSKMGPHTILAPKYCWENSIKCTPRETRAVAFSAVTFSAVTSTVVTSCSGTRQWGSLVTASHSYHQLPPPPPIDAIIFSSLNKTLLKVFFQDSAIFLENGAKSTSVRKKHTGTLAPRKSGEIELQTPRTGRILTFKYWQVVNLSSLKLLSTYNLVSYRLPMN